MPTSDESITPDPLPANEHEWISYEEATALVWRAFPEFKDNGEAARAALIRALENGKIQCRNLHGREMRPDDVMDSPLSYVNVPYAFYGGIKATRWWGVRNAFPASAFESAAGAQAKKRAPKGIADFWPYVLGRYLARLARDGMPPKQKDLEDILASLIEEAGRTAEPSTVRRYAAGIRTGWNSEGVD